MNQLVLYYSLFLLFKTKMDKKPVYIYEHIGDQPGRNTQQEADRVGDHILRDIRNFETGTAKKTFIPHAVQDWNNLPTSLREQISLVLFKKKLRAWMLQNIPIIDKLRTNFYNHWCMYVLGRSLVWGDSNRQDLRLLGV